MQTVGRVWVAGVVAYGLLLAACASDPTSTTAFQGFVGCHAGAESAIAFLQRSLDDAGDVNPDELEAALPEFDRNVRAMMLRAREVHCTEEGFNAAIIARVDELEASGPGGELIVEMVRARGLGSLDDGGRLIGLPG